MTHGNASKAHEIMTHVKLRDEDIDPNLFANWLARVRGIELASRSVMRLSRSTCGGVRWVRDQPGTGETDRLLAQESGPAD
jgi:hypothetical protein